MFTAGARWVVSLAPQTYPRSKPALSVRTESVWGPNRTWTLGNVERRRALASCSPRTPYAIAGC